MIPYNLFLDDFRIPQDAFKYKFDTRYNKLKWVTVINYKQFTETIIDKVKSGYWPELISFDHDLADEHYNDDMYKGVEKYSELYKNFTEKTGYDCAKWLVDYCIDNDLKLPECLVHSMNPAGGENIKSLLDNFKKFQNES